MNSKPRYLTKSRFKLAAECPTKLFYTGKENVYKNSKSEDSFLSMLAEGGYQVGELAKLYWPGGIEVESQNHQEAEKITLELLKHERVVLFEPAIRFGDLFARVDILVKDGNNYHLIEVKAKSYNSTNPQILGVRGEFKSDMRSYIEDVAFQAFIFKSAFPTARLKTSLMMPDKAVRVTVNGLNQLFQIKRDGRQAKVITSPEAKYAEIDKKILALVPTDEYINKIFKEGVNVLGHKRPLHELANEWSVAYKTDKKIKPHPGSQCSQCEFISTSGDGLRDGFKECWEQAFQLKDEDFIKGTVLDIYKFKNKDHLIAKGRVLMSSVLPSDIEEKNEGDHLSLSERQWMQIRGIPAGEDRGGYWVAESLLRREMNAWTYPYHFIDFETSTVAIPFHSGMRPYEPVAFQFSHHVMHEDGRIEHAGEFLLTDPIIFPNFEFAQALKAQLDQDQGTIFMWSKHERTILSKIIEQLSETDTPPTDAEQLIIFLKSLIDKDGQREMFDLCELSERTYYHEFAKGSSSIKKILPSILRSSNRLGKKYKLPIYGSLNGISSKNFRNTAWWVDDGSGAPKDPYQLLKEHTKNLLTEDTNSSEVADKFDIAEGGAAATAYARLQFEDMDEATRTEINEALLRYCELDTLAMVMIVEGWKDFL
jgi:hypothetical protein